MPDEIVGWSTLSHALATARSELFAAAPSEEDAREAEAYLLRVMTACLSDAFLNHLLTQDGLSRALPTKGGPNPDYLLWHAPVDPTGRYRLEGRLNDSERVGVGLYSFAGGATVLEGYARFDRTTVDASGRFALDIAAEATGPGTLKSTPASRVLLIRTLHRAAHGQPCSLTLAGGASQPRLSPAAGNSETALQMAGQATLRGVRQYLEWSRQTRADPNRFGLPASLAAEVRSDPDTHYSLGYYELGDGELLEVTMPEGIDGYWSLHAYNHWCEYLPGASVHDLSAVPDQDGRIRARIGTEVASDTVNRIDTLGRRRGVLIFRTIGGRDAGIPQAQLLRR